MTTTTTRRLPNRQKFLFLAVGATNLLIGLGWFAVFHVLFGDQVGYMGTLVLAYAAAILCAFALHRWFVFKVRGQVWVDLFRFTLVQMVALSINALTLPFMIEVVGLPVLPAQVGAAAVVVVFSYFGHLLFSFRRSHHHADLNG